ncbi:uncharacterized protein LOC105697488 [Orussus abietinus]|uniref:uncharacterized protein LOC105697488 n=1 Tax=Orussus abietinus TaxID=222816 RepID=UPI000C716208|nr:uncharacterized protein LOC105697488 [Orussus abietinus]
MVRNETIPNFRFAGGYAKPWDSGQREKDYYGYPEEEDEVPRKRVRIRVPVVRNTLGKQHKFTVVRRRPLVPYTKSYSPQESQTPSPRRVVVTRVRTLGPASALQTVEAPDLGGPSAADGRHKVTVTRRRKLGPTTVDSAFNKPRVTRKKLVNVRPVIQPSSTLAVITTGFYTAPDDDDEDDTVEEAPGIPELTDPPTGTPSLEETPNYIENKPDIEYQVGTTPSEMTSDLAEPSSHEEPVIITDNFFFPPSGDDEYEEEYDQELPESTTEQKIMEEMDGSSPKSGQEQPGETLVPVITERDEADTTTERILQDGVTTERILQAGVTTERILQDGVTTEMILQADATTERILQDGVTTEKILQADATTEKAPRVDATTESDVDLDTTMKDSDVFLTTTSLDEPTTDSEVLETTTEEEEAKEVTTEKEATTAKEEKDVTTETTDYHDRPSTADYVERPFTMVPEIIPEESAKPDDAPKSTPEEQPEDVVSSTVPQEGSSEIPIADDSTTPNGVDETSMADVSTPEGIDDYDLPKTEPPSGVTSKEDDAVLSVIPIESVVSETDRLVKPSTTFEPTERRSEPAITSHPAVTIFPEDLENSDIPSVIPLGGDPTSGIKPMTTSSSQVTTKIASPTPEEIEAGLADDLYLSLSRPDFPQILPSKPIDDVDSHPPMSVLSTPELSTSVYYTETVVTSTRLRTYTYVVTKLNGPETEVTSSTTVRPRVTTLTLTVPVTVTVTPTAQSSLNSVSPVLYPESGDESAVKDEEEGRRFNLATRVMSNGVEVIVAGPTPALRWENSNPQPTLTLSDTVVMLLPQDKPNDFVTKTCMTTFTYLNTITRDGTTIVSTDEQVVANTATEERHRKPGSETARVTLEASPTLRTEVFKTTYTYLTLNTDHPDADNALESSMKVITNTVTAPQHYLDMVLEPSESPGPETNAYLSTRILQKTIMEEGRTRIETTSDTVTQLIITESAPPPRPTSVTTTLTALDNTEVATSTDVVMEKVPMKKTATKTVPVNQTPEPIQIFATKTYFTTYTFFTTLQQAGADGNTSTTISSRFRIVENVVTESIAPSLLDAGYMNALLTTAHHSDSVKNVVTGSTIIFFDEKDQIDPTSTLNSQDVATASVEVENIEKSPAENTHSAALTNSTPTISSSDAQTGDQASSNESGDATVTSSNESTQNKKPSSSQNEGDLQVSNLLSLGSLGINGLSALGPVITAMAGLLQGKTSASRRNDTVTNTEAQEATTPRSPIYIPVAEFADGDIETAESQNMAAHLANLNHNYLPETRHKVAASLADGIPISPGEIITANSDVIIGKPGKMGPRPPQTFLKEGEHVGMKPPPPPVPNIPVHPVLEVLHDDQEDSQAQPTTQVHKGPHIQILPAHQVYEEHVKIPATIPLPKRPQKLHPIHSAPPKRAGSKHDILENDPLLKPPGRPNVEQYANPNVNINEPEWSPEKYRRPWSAKDPLTPLESWLENKPKVPSRPDETPADSSVKVKPWQSNKEPNRPSWAQKDPLLPDTMIETSEAKPQPDEPIVHQVPHVIDRSTGQPLLVNIQPSQVANVVIPQGGTQALIFGDTNEPHISGHYFDDPSPYPESEVGPGFIRVEKVEDASQYSGEKDPAEFLVPPSPPINFRPLPEKPGSSRPNTIPLSPSQSHFDHFRPQDKVELLATRPDRKPEVHLIQRPDGADATSGQGHVHTEILVHHRPETVNIRPQPPARPSILSHVHPPRRDYLKPQRPGDTLPPRRTEMHVPTEVPHQYVFLGKPADSGNEVTFNTSWKTDKKPPRIAPGVRPRPSARPRPPFRTTSGPHSHLIYMERPGHPVRKPQYTVPQRPKPQGNYMTTIWSAPNPQPSQEPPKKHLPNIPQGNAAQEQYGHRPQVDLQDRPPNFYRGKPKPQAAINVSENDRNEEHVPTGAVEYHNPSTDPKVKPEDTQYYPQLPTIKPEVQSFGQLLPHPDRDEAWTSNTQTEQPLMDSEAGESENLKVHNPLQNQGGKDHEQDVNSAPTSQMENNMTHSTKNPYGAVGSLNTVVGKPLNIDQGITYGQKDQTSMILSQGVPFGHKKDDTAQNAASDYQGVRPYETPIVQGKPFGVYNDHVDPGRPYGYGQKIGRPDYEIVQGVPFGFHVKQNPPQDDTIDLKPPAISPLFGPEPERPKQRPYHRPHGIGRPDTRVPLYSRPEIVTKPPRKFEVTRPDQHRPTEHPQVGSGIYGTTVNHLGGFTERPGEGQLGEEQTVHEHPDWSIRIPENEKIRPYQDQSYELGNHHDYSRNQTSSHPNRGSFYTDFGNPKPGADMNRPMVRPDHGIATQVHPEYPHILTKPKPQVPGPITISSRPGKPHGQPVESNRRPNIQFSLPVEATGDEEDSKTQTERPPSMLVTKGTQKPKYKNEPQDTYQTSIASQDQVDEETSDIRKTESNHQLGPDQSEAISTQKPKVPSQNMMPPPVRPVPKDPSKKSDEQEGLKPPPLPSDVVGLSPPPVAITTTNRPKDDFPFAIANESGLRPPPKYIPLEESIAIATPPPPGINMVPPSPRPTIVKPFLVEILSQDMVPPPPVPETSRPPQIATVRPAVAVSGSIQIATAVATSHIPVVQDMESKIPIIHGTVDLPMVIDVPSILRPVETRKPEHVSIYTVRPFETRQVSRVSVQPTAILTTNLIMPTRLRPLQTDHVEPSRSVPSISSHNGDPTKLPSPEVVRKPTKRPDRPVFIESSQEITVTPSRVEPTESLTHIVDTVKTKDQKMTLKTDETTKVHRQQVTEFSTSPTKLDQAEDTPTIVTRVDSSISKVTNTLKPERKDSVLPSIQVDKDIAGPIISNTSKNASATTLTTMPKVTRMSTVTRTETSILGSPPTTRTLLLTHTYTTTTVEIITETLRPTSVVSTVTSTIVTSVTRVPPSYENTVDNDSIFVVMSDQKPPEPGAEEVEAEYGEEEASRDEQDPGGNEVHRVLAGGILGAPVVPLQPVINHCVPECRASKSEVCAEVGSEMRCVCRPGFARMFPDRPCKPTYTYTLRVGLERIARDPIANEISLNDSTSAAYKRLTGPVKDALDRTLMQSDLRDLYRGLNIAGFNPSPATVDFHLQLSENANETRLKEVLRKYLVSSNFSLGGTEVFASKDLDLIDARDFDECSTEEGGPHHDCSPNAACFNIRGSYQCSCREGWADLSENPAYPGRVCSQAPLGCAGCNNKGHCVTNTNGQEVCECFPWHSGQRCQVNLKVLLIALVTTGAILLSLLMVCVGMACFRRPGRRSGDRRAMIPGTGGDTSSEGSVTDLAIPHHVPHVLPPPPQMIAPAPPLKRPVRKISGKPRHPARKPSAPTPIPMNDEQRDRSLTVMIPRAKYRSAPQSPQNYKPVMSTFAADEHKLISYLESGSHPRNRRASVASIKDYKEPDLQVVRTPVAPSGALVSAGFQVSATVVRTADAESTLARSCGETTVEPSTKILRSGDLSGDLGSTLARSCGETTIQTPTKILRLDLAEDGSTLARSCGETTIQPPTKVAVTGRSSLKDSRDNRDNRDNASDGHTMAERDLGSTLRLPAQHPPLYNPDRTSDRESNFDSL